MAYSEGQLDRACLVGYFSLETTTQSNLLRERRGAIFREWRAPFASCITELIGTTIQEWLIDLGFGSSPQRKAAMLVFPPVSRSTSVFFQPA